MMTITEPETITETPEQARSREVAERIQRKFDEQEGYLLKQEEIARTLRAFFLKYHDAIAPFEWTNYGWNPEIEFWRGGNDAKAVAKAFGATGWRREHNHSSCGSIDWLKTIDGVTLTIVNAESIKPKLIDEVKL